jgi:hypothetical protein
MESVLGLIQTHLITKEPGPLIELLGPMMGLVTAPYLDRPDVEREIERGARFARTIQAGDIPDWLTPPPPEDTEPELPTMLENPSAHRARECMRFLTDHPDSSNREIAAGIGVTHQSQISKLLSYLAGENLVSKCSEGMGKRNAWRLTPHGEEIAGMLAERDA